MVVIYSNVFLLRMNRQEEEWRADVEASLAMKDSRAKMIEMEKQELIEEVLSNGIKIVYKVGHKSEPAVVY